jgi:membrane protein insertase Oxa1/YidC/SpoIIIJ
LALLAGLTQFFQARLMIKNNNQITPNKTESNFQNDLMKSMQIQTMYVLPIIIAFVAYGLGGLIALYFLTSNIFSIFQQFYFKNKIKKEEEKNTVVQLAQ